MGGSSGGPFGYRPPLIPVPELQLDPKIVAMLQQIEAEVEARRTIQLWLKPEWRSAEQDLGRLILSMPPPSPAPPFAPQGAGPDTPRPGQISDVVRGLWALPIVQQKVDAAYSEFHRQLSVAKRDWGKASTGEKFGIITLSGVIVGASGIAIMIPLELRTKILGMAEGKDIPVPGVEGLSFQIRKRGGQVTVPTTIPGLSVQAGAGSGVGGRPMDYDFMLQFDVARYLRYRNIMF